MQPSGTSAGAQLCQPQELTNRELDPKKIEDKLRNQANNNKKNNKSWALSIFLPIFDLGSFQAFPYSSKAEELVFVKTTFVCNNMTRKPRL